MKLVPLLVNCLCLAVTAKAQDSTNKSYKNVKQYTIHIFKTDGSIQKGVLYKTEEQGITVAPYSNDLQQLYTLSPEQINSLYLRRKGSVGRGALFGGLTGLVVGFLIGYASGDDSCTDFCVLSSPSETGATGAVIGVMAGAGTGMIIGASTKKKFRILGKRENYRLNYQYLVEKAMVK